MFYVNIEEYHLNVSVLSLVLDQSEVISRCMMKYETVCLFDPKRLLTAPDELRATESLFHHNAQSKVNQPYNVLDLLSDSYHCFFEFADDIVEEKSCHEVVDHL
jgi:hypothetical protein